MPRLFVDLDGVLADFNGGFQQRFGAQPDPDTYQPAHLWQQLRGARDFYAQLPLLPDARELWRGVQHLQPVILTGIPEGCADVARQKRQWVAQHIGPTVRVICCLSTQKRQHGSPGDVLVDDRLKYAHHWVEMGGVFVHHVNARATLKALSHLPGAPFDSPALPYTWGDRLPQ